VAGKEWHLVTIFSPVALASPAAGTSIVKDQRSEVDVALRSTGSDDSSALSSDAGGEARDGTALDRGDEIVQQLTIAKYALTVGDTVQAMDAIDAALTTSRGSLSELAGANGPPHNPTFAGALVRTTAAGTSLPQHAEGDAPLEGLASS
jgi:hypothetical protein